MAATALSATQNNYLTHQQMEMLQEELRQCERDGSCDAVVQRYSELSQLQDQTLLQECATDPTGSACQSGLREALNYVGDESWKNYVVQLGVDRESTPMGFDHMDVDIERSRRVALDLALSNPAICGAINDIEPRADFFGAMHREAGAVWFDVAENTSRTQLQGIEYEAGSFLSRLGVIVPQSWFGTATIDEWRAAAGSQTMANGYTSFRKIYTQSGIDTNAWSRRQLVNEQHDPELQRIHEYFLPQINQLIIQAMEWRGGVEDILKPRERVVTGCRAMRMPEDCGE